MPVVERKYTVEVGDIDNLQTTTLTVRFVSPDKDALHGGLLDWLLLNFPKWLEAKEIPQCPHTHGQEKGCSCKRQCQRPAGHKGNHYYAWGKAGREQMERDREKYESEKCECPLCHEIFKDRWAFKDHYAEEHI